MTSTAELAFLDATAQAALVRSGEVSAAELVSAAIARIEAVNPALNAMVTPLYDGALSAASSPAPGPFAGVPFLVKDLILEMAGAPLSEGSAFLHDFVSPVDSALMARFRAAGLVTLGKTNTSEFGLLPACEPVRNGPTRNPWDLSRSTSGSSGGAAAAVAAGLVPMAHGNDIGGSLRYPASACGVFGLKPTRGRNSLAPYFGDLLNGLEVEHAITRSVRDSAALLDATCGPVLGDPYWAAPPAQSFLPSVSRDPGRLRIAFTPRTSYGTVGHPDCVAALDDAVGLLVSLGHEVVEADLPGMDHDVIGAIGTLYNCVAAWVVAQWSARLGRSPEPGELEPLTESYLSIAASISASTYLMAVQRLQAFTRTVAEWMTDYDAWLTPTLSRPPLALGEMTSTPAEPMRALLRAAETIEYPGFVVNVLGVPAMSVPLWWNADALPIGVQFMGRYGEEALLFGLAGQLERARPWAGRIPPVNAAS